MTLLEELGSIAFGIVLAVTISKIAGYALGTDLPIVAVMTGSMSHDSTTDVRHYLYLEKTYGYTPSQIDSWPISNGFNPGDVIIIKGVEEEDVKIGDVIIFTYEGQPVPIIHRVVNINDDHPFTKGDHNTILDPDCKLLDNPYSGCWRRISIKGKAVFVIPYLGYPKLLLNKLM